MDFEKIYADFESARATHDLETMSKIIVQVMKHCGELAHAGRVNEIPPVANKIAAHVNVMIYYAMKLLSDGDAGKAKIYLNAPESPDLKINEGFFFHVLPVRTDALSCG